MKIEGSPKNESEAKFVLQRMMEVLGVTVCPSCNGRGVVRRRFKKITCTTCSGEGLVKATA